MAARALLLELALDHDLRGDSGVIGADHPVGVVAAHAVVADERVHQGLLERVAHVQRAGDVRRRQLDAVGRRLVIAVAEVAARFPALVAALFDCRGVEALVEHYLVSGSCSACATDAATASRTICVTLTVNSVRTPSSAWPSTWESVRASFSSITRSTSGASRVSTARSSSRASASSAAASIAGRSSRASATTSVSTGTLDSRSGSAIGAREIVVADAVTAAFVEAIAAARRFTLAIVGADHLEQPLEARKMRRALGAEVEEHVEIGRRALVARDQHRRIRGERVIDCAVRHEAGRGPGPHQPIQTLRELRLWRVYEQPFASGERLRSEAAGGLESVRGVEIELHVCHLRPAWRSAKRTRSGTGRPVEPFSRPLFQAVPAMSRCAQRCLRVKRARKDAAVMLPPGRPPMLAKSAKLERSCSWYSSHSGICQTRSQASSAAARSSSASFWSLAKSPVATWPSAMTHAPVSVATLTSASGLKRSA